MAPSNTNGGVGTLVPGVATFEVQLLDGQTVLQTRIIGVVLQPSTVGIATLQLGDAVISIDSTEIPIILGSQVVYAATLRNSGANLSNVVLQSYINQGTVHAGVGTMAVSAGAGNGVLPSGFVNVTGAISTFPSGGGRLLTTGSGTFELQMLANGTLLEAKTLPVILTRDVDI